MKISVVCPHCSHMNRIDVNDRDVRRICCEDAQDGGCGDYFGFRIAEIKIETFKKITVEK